MRAGCVYQSLSSEHARRILHQRTLALKQSSCELQTQVPALNSGIPPGRERINGAGARNRDIQVVRDQALALNGILNWPPVSRRNRENLQVIAASMRKGSFTTSI